MTSRVGRGTAWAVAGHSDDTVGRGIVYFSILLVLSSTAAAAPLLDPSASGFGGQTRSQNYDALLDALFANTNVVTAIGDRMWVPWYSTSSSCQVSDLHSGSSCNSGQAIDLSHNCMVTDEFSQVGVLVAMGDDQARMDRFYNTVVATKSTNGKIPAWRVYRDGDTIQACRSGINGNCDTASDATARIIIALFAASDNGLFADQAQKDAYAQLARDLSADFLAYEVDQTCRPSSLGYGDICYWMAAGSNAKRGGLASTDYGYTGYYADGIIAMLQACAQTDDLTYCRVAGNLTLNYLQAAYPQGTSTATFRVPPGRSFKWDTSAGIPKAVCTNTCSPDQWDGADAPRALGMCQANYYAQQIGHTLPGLSSYCTMWGQAHMTNTNSAPVQYYADGTPRSAQSGYMAQGLQALFQMGGHDPTLFTPTVTNALNHYSTSSKTWDNAACFGVYNQAFAIRALGAGIGRDSASFPALGQTPTPPPVTPPPVTPPPPAPQNISFTSVSPSASTVTISEPNNQTFTYTLSNPDGLSTTVTWSVDGTQRATSGTSFSYTGGYDTQGTHTVVARVVSPQNTIERTWTLTVTDTAQPVPVEPNIYFATLSPAGSSVSISEPSNRTFSFTLGNASGIGTTTTWYVDGAAQGGRWANSQTFVYEGSYDAAGTHNVSARVVSSRGTIQRDWSLIVSDTPQGVQPIAFSSTAPATSTSATQPSTPTFSFSLSNPSGLATATTWTVDGVAVVGAAGTSLLLPQVNSGIGTHIIMARVVSSMNTISKTWTLTIAATPTSEPTPSTPTPDPAPSDPAKTGSGGGGGGGGGGGALPRTDGSITDEPTTAWSGPVFLPGKDPFAGDGPRAPQVESPAPTGPAFAGSDSAGSGGGGSERVTREELQSLIAGFYEPDRTVKATTVVSRLRAYLAQEDTR